ncbi:hypothetical protein ACFL35_20450 [Candidatus Riflebacteria bacterium]
MGSGLTGRAIVSTRQKLCNAIQNGNTRFAIQLAADLGHYIGDLCQPLHVSKFYDGKSQSARGIHKSFEVILFNQLEKDIKILPFSMEYIPNRETAFHKYIESGLAEIENIFQADLKARKIAPIRGELYFKSLKASLAKMLQKRIQLATELLAGVYYSILQDLLR